MEITRLMLRKINKLLILFLVGGSIYYGIEFAYKGLISNSPTHWSMGLLGGLCFILIGGINEFIPWEVSIIKQGITGACIVTSLEFIFGAVLNIYLGLGIWDYSTLPFNVCGQICLPFSIAWFGLSIIAIILDDYLRWKWFNEDKPHYHLHDKVCY